MARSAREQWAIKIILCAGLYPQFAIADPANLARPQADYQFSTMLRDGLVIHPSSVCARHNLDASASGSGHDRAQVLCAVLARAFLTTVHTNSNVWQQT
jgi:hypothetical protein